MQQEKTKRLVVLGAGESGVGAAVLGKARNWDVFVSDVGTIAPKYKEEMEREGIAYEEGGHTAEKILNADMCVKSPVHRYAILSATAMSIRLMVILC